VRNGTFRRLLALTAALCVLGAACGDDDDDDGATEPVASGGPGDGPCDASQAPDELQTVTLQLDWTPNTNHTGFYAADALGCYAEAGLDLEVLPFADTIADTIVGAGQADFGISFHSSVALSGPAGTPLVAVAAVLQKTAEAIAVKADRDDLASPRDLDGKVYAGFGGPAEAPLLRSIIQADGGTGEFESVVLTTSAYDAVYSGQADFTITFTLWEGIQATLAGEPVKYFQYDDYGLPNQYSVMLVTSQDRVREDPETVRAFLEASRKGWDYAAANPDAAAQLLIDANPDVFEDPELVLRSAREMAEGGYLLAEDGHWGAIDPAVFAGFAGFLFDAGIVAGEDGDPLPAEPDWSQYVDATLFPSG
jgi:ABC-type nitrate/sulfonate/bicarbonate transport system substrate-binding protein